MQIAMPIFQYAFPGCQALFAFDNASNHRYFAPDALLASNISLNPGGKHSLASERDLIMAEVYRRLWCALIVVPALQYAVNLREQRQFFVSAVSGHITASALGVRGFFLVG